MSQGKDTLNAAHAARLLDIDPAADPDTVKRAFRAAAKAAHPDRPGGDSARLRAVIEAYNALKARAAARLAPGADRPAPAPTLDISPLEALCGGRRLMRSADGRKFYVSLPAGLRAGDQVRVAGQIRAVAICGAEGLAVIGDHLCLSIAVDPLVLRLGGAVAVGTPLGPRSVRVTRQDGLRGLARVVGHGLPPRAGRPRGDLLLRLAPQEVLGPAEPSEAQDKLRRFMADWAA